MTDFLDLSSGDVDLIAVLDSLLPDEQALSKAALVQSRLRTQLRETRDEIGRLTALLAKDQSANRVQAIHELIIELLGQTTRIKEKALESETIVKEITRDIQTLDKGKKNLTGSITVLRRLQMLVNALGQLETLIPSKRYREIASRLAAVKELSASFKPYTTVDRVAAVYRSVQERQNKCRGMVTEEFEAFFVPEPNSPPPSPSVMSGACAVVDVLGDEVRNSLLDRYASLELREYRRIFRSTDEAGQLDNVARRYAWFRRVLKSHDDERDSVFPEGWRVGVHLTARFAEATSHDLENVLAKASPLSVTLLLEALQATTSFETQMSQKYNISFAEIARSVAPSTSYSNPFTPISTVFEQYLSVYVDAQDKAIADILAPSRGLRSRSSLDQARQASGETPATVLPSSTDLFYFYGQTLEQCSRLSRAGPLRDLVKVFAKWLRIYAEDVLLTSLKRSDPGRRSTDRRSTEGRVNIQELKTACLVLNTADYCRTTAAQLEEMTQEKIVSELKDQVSFDNERTIFISVISSCLLSLLRELETAIEPIIALILRTPWEHTENVSGPSAYVLELVRAINAVVDVVQDGVESKKYARNFCDKAVGIVMSRMTQALVKSRPLKKVGAEQLLLDLSLLKRCFVELPHFSKEDNRSQASYQRLVQNSTSHFETILKIILAPEDPPEAFVQNYTLLVGDRSFSNFQKILDLKGTSKKDSNHLLDIFVAVSSVTTDLTDASFLSSLDMDPPAAPLSVLASASPADRALLSPTMPSVGVGSLPDVGGSGGAGVTGGREGAGIGGGKGFSFFRNLRRESGLI